MLKLTFIVLLSFFSVNLFASTWTINRDHSEILFQVPYMNVSELTGRFNEFNGEVLYKEDNRTIESLFVQISSSSIDTANKMRDGHLKGNDFLKAEEHPYITFKSNKVVPLDKKRYKASGDMTIRGIKKPAVIEFSTTEQVKDTWGYDNKFVKFKSVLNRKDYHIIWNKTLDGQEFLVGDIITFWGTFQIQPSKAQTPNSKHMIPDTQYIRDRDNKRNENESSFSKSIRKLINGK
jgi:polyisoprenoid-binding protein YceI